MSECRKFPPEGLTYFWFLNDYCDDCAIDKQIEEFGKSGISTVCLHPRDGLLLPYGGDDWFDFIRRTVLKLAVCGIEVWLYDEDPFPSGNAGGRIVLDHPEFIAHNIVMHQASADEIQKDGLWFFPAKGKLLLCAFISEDDSDIVADKTSNVGMIRRSWQMMKNWDSKWYYPATPLYISDRAQASIPEYALKAGRIPEKQKLVAFTIEPVTPSSAWKFYVDTLNPRATGKFIEYTHEKYLKCVGDMFGGIITAIFTDESKYFGGTPWTPGIFEDFMETYGYDLRLRLFDIFSNQETPKSILTRLNYREWCGRRFEKSWLEPVSDWCRKHKLKLVGHLSPEEDPVSQAFNLSNLMPLQKHMSLAGLDLIIPAVGDKRHPMLNVGILSAVSSAQQHGLPGVMSESLACSGKDCSLEKICKILNWQTVMGMSAPVIHGIFHSLREEREFECPPDFGPRSGFSDGLIRLSRELVPIQDMLRGATQIAPVAILWPIKSFHLQNLPWQAEPGGLREEFMDLILGCLESQVGVQILDEADFSRAELKNGVLRVGNASYSHVIVPGSNIWAKDTWDLLKKYSQANLHVYQYGTNPKYLESENEISRNLVPAFRELTDKTIKTDLPKVIEISSDDTENIRVTAWMKGGLKFHLLCYLGEGAIKAKAVGRHFELSSQIITVL